MKRFSRIRSRFLIIIVTSISVLLTGCFSDGDRDDNSQNTLHIIHAGSLTYPVKLIAEAYREEHPDVQIFTEAWGSKAGARRIMEIETPCDVYLSADYAVIENMLIHDHASWHIKFAANEMSIVYTEESRYAGEITQDNWYTIMLRPDVSIGRSNPDHDPCGVRSVFTARLAELYYQTPDLANQLLSKNPQNIRPKETDLIALLESNHVDYIFLYRSVAQQHKLPYLRLPPQLSLGDPALESWYAQVSTETLGATPGSTITETGGSMVYGLTIPHKSVNRELAVHFLEFLLDKETGMQILEAMGQPSVVPSSTPYYNEVPERLKGFATKSN